MSRAALPGLPAPGGRLLERWVTAYGWLVVPPLLLILWWPPDRLGLFPPCPFHALTGLLCPGCGSLRTLHHVLHGRLTAAWASNPLLMVLLPLFAWEYVGWAIRGCGGRWRSVPWPPRSAWAALAVIVSYGVLRNIPAHPFTLLAPH